MNKNIKNHQYSSDSESDSDSESYREIDEESKSSTPFNRSSTLLNVSSASRNPMYSPPTNINLSGPDNSALIRAFQSSIDFYQKYVDHNFYESRFPLGSLQYNQDIVPDELKEILSNLVNVLTNVGFNFFPEMITPKMQMNQF
jgi:hypothetical protein